MILPGRLSARFLFVYLDESAEVFVRTLFYILLNRTVMNHDHFSNAEITVSWDPGKCIHAGICYSRLRKVFDPLRRPWIDPNAAETERIIETVGECPSGALSFVWNEETAAHPVVPDPLHPVF